MNARPRVIHFVTGGGSGATKVALDVACGHLRTGHYEPLLVLRRKKAALPPAMVAQIEATKLPVAWVENGFKFFTRRRLLAIIADFQPDVFVAHGNSEHLWGRQAAFRAKVPVVIHVEHSCERYRWWRRYQSRQLAAQTSATVCVSQGVADYVRQLHLGSPRLEVIHNGIAAATFADTTPLAQRRPDIVMAARFARQKDQPTLIRAVKRLVDTGWQGRLILAGGGSSRHRAQCEKLTRDLGLGERVQFPGSVKDIARLYRECRVAVLSTKFEGMPLSLVEYMASGCAAIASAIPGVTDVIRDRENGWLFPQGDDAALAEALHAALSADENAQAIATRGQADAVTLFPVEKMIARYEALFRELSSARREQAG